jgi:hypothetical protein
MKDFNDNINNFNITNYNIKTPFRRTHYLLDKNIIYDSTGKQIKFGTYVQLPYIQNKFQNTNTKIEYVGKE